MVRKSLLLAHGYTITEEVIRKALDQTRPPSSSAEQSFAEQVSEVLAGAQRGERESVLSDLIEVIERELYAQAIRRAGGDQTKAARWLGVSRPTMREKLSKFGLHPARS